MKTLHSSLLGLSLLTGLVSGVLCTSAPAQITYKSVTVVATASNSTEATGVSALVSFKFDASFHTIEITLTNTSSMSSTLYGFGFDTPWAVSSGSVSVTRVSGTPGTFKTLQFNTGPSGAPLSGPGGKFDLWLGDTGGNTTNSNGLTSLPSETATYRFSFAGTISDSLFNANTFFASNGSDPDLGLRFRQVDLGRCVNEASEKVWVTIPTDPETPPIGEIPEPSTYGALGALALLSLAGIKKLKARNPLH